MEASFVMGSGLRRKMLLRDRQKKTHHIFKPAETPY